MSTKRSHQVLDSLQTVTRRFFSVFKPKVKHQGSRSTSVQLYSRNEPRDNRFGKVHVCNICEQVDYALKRGKASLKLWFTDFHDERLKMSPSSRINSFSFAALRSVFLFEIVFIYDQSLMQNLIWKKKDCCMKYSVFNVREVQNDVPAPHHCLTQVVEVKLFPFPVRETTFLRLTSEKIHCFFIFGTKTVWQVEKVVGLALLVSLWSPGGGGGDLSVSQLKVDIHHI